MESRMTVRLRAPYLDVQELLVSPYLLLQNNIPVVRCVQYPGEFIINYPGAVLIPEAVWSERSLTSRQFIIVA
jgi:hypothetical protein